MKKRHSALSGLLFALIQVLVSPAMAEETGGVTIELSTLEPVGQGCRMSLLVESSHSEGIDRAVYETVLFDGDGRVTLLTLLDLRDLPVARPRVRQFEFSEIPCPSIGKVLINGASTCTAKNLPSDACENGLKLRNRTDAELIG